MSSDDDDDDAVWRALDWYDSAQSAAQVVQKFKAVPVAAEPTLITDLSVIPDINAIFATRASTKAASSSNVAASSSSTQPAAVPSSGFAASVPFSFGSMSSPPSTAPAAAAVAPTTGFSSSIPFSFTAASSAASSSQPTAPVASGFSSSVPFSFAPAASTTASVAQSFAPSGFSSSVPFSFAPHPPGVTCAATSEVKATAASSDLSAWFAPSTSVDGEIAALSAITQTKSATLKRKPIDSGEFALNEQSSSSFAFPSSLVSAAPKSDASKEDAAVLLRELRQRHPGAKAWSLHTKEEKPQPVSSDQMARDNAAAEAAAAAASAATVRAAADAATSSSDSAQSAAPSIFGLPAPAAAAAPAPVPWAVPGSFYSSVSLPSFASVPVGPIMKTIAIAPAPSYASLPAFDPSTITQPKPTFGFSFASVDPTKFASLAAAATGAFAPRQLPRADGRPLDVYKDILVSIFRMLHFPDLHWCMAACKEWQSIVLSMNPLKLTFSPSGRRLLMITKRLNGSRLAARHMGHLLLSPYEHDATTVSEVELNTIAQQMTSLQTIRIAIMPSSDERAALDLPRTLKELRLVVQPKSGRAPPHPNMWACLADLHNLTTLEVIGTLFPLSVLKGHPSLTSLSIPELASAADVECVRTLTGLDSIELNHSVDECPATSAELVLALFATPNPFPALARAEFGPAMDWPELSEIYRRLPTLQTVRWEIVLSQPEPFDYSMLYSLPKLQTVAMSWITNAAWFLPPEVKAEQTASQVRDAEALIAPFKSLRAMRVLSLSGHPQLTTAALSAALSSMAQLEELILDDFPRVGTLSFLVSSAAPFAPTLRRLRLDSCHQLMTLAELSHLRGLPSLKLLQLVGVRLMDASVRHALDDGLLPQLPFLRDNPAQNTITMWATDPRFLRLC